MLATVYTDADGNLISKDRWYDLQFLASTSYYVTRWIGGGKYDQAIFKTYPEAMKCAMETERALLYFDSTVLGLNIPRDRFEHFLKLYNTATGQNLRMPPFNQPLNPKTKG